MNEVYSDLTVQTYHNRGWSLGLRISGITEVSIDPMEAVWIIKTEKSSRSSLEYVEAFKRQGSSWVVVTECNDQ